MRLDQLLGGVEVLGWSGDPASTEVVAITHDSRAVQEGSLFCCIRGERVDGHAFAANAVAAGASALVCEHLLELSVTQVVVRDTRTAMAHIAGELFGHPSRRLRVIGVTGTNGKTTTTHLLAAVLEAGGQPTSIVGTLSGPRTTPEAPELQGRLAQLLDQGQVAVAMEVSSHALALHRVDAMWFTLVVFTNLSQDHLDFHGDMEQYFRAKASLFSPERAATAIVNADDPYGRLLLDSARLPTRPFSMDEAVGLEVGPAGARFSFEGEPVDLRLGGAFNVANAVAAAVAARELGISASDVAVGLSSVASIPGRYERIDVGQPFTVVVDYAHTPAGLEVVLGASRPADSQSRLIVVFGCGGDRDRDKRPAMGEVATRLANLAVLTSDNPRSEDPDAIIREVLSGVRTMEHLVVEPDRRAAIALALTNARPGDVVVIAGKGHETTQVIGDQELPFDDRRVASEMLVAREPAP